MLPGIDLNFPNPFADITEGLRRVVSLMLTQIQTAGNAEPFNVSGAVSATPAIAAAIQTLSMTILSIMALVELVSAIQRYGGDTAMGAKVISFTLFKIALLVTVAKQGTQIANAVFAEGGALKSSVGDSLATNGFGGAGNSADLVASANVGDLLGSFVLLLIPWILSFVPLIAAKVVLAVVELQAYLLMAFASLPLAFLANAETRSMAVGYLKKLFSLAITPVVVLGLIAMYRALIGAPRLGESTSVVEWVGTNFVDLIAAPILLTVLIVSSASLANKVLGD